MTTITQVREDAVKFDLLVSEQMPEVFTDGISQMLMGVPVSKLTFHSVTNPADPSSGIEQRTGVLRLIIPTPVLLEMCRNILSGAHSSLDAFSDAGKQIDTRVRTIMNGVSITKLAGEETTQRDAQAKPKSTPKNPKLKAQAKPKALAQPKSKTKR